MVAFTRSSLRKIPVAVAASARELAGAGPKVGIVFHHIPKCAGTSVTAALSGAYAPWTYRMIDARSSVAAIRYLDLGGDANGSDAWALIHAFRQRLLFTYLYSGARAVGGHVFYNPRIHDAFATTHRFVTVLREPVERFTSQYLYCTRSQSYDHVDTTWGAGGLSKVGPVWGRTIATFLGGRPNGDGSMRSFDSIVENAKRALDRLDVVGFVDDLPAFGTAVAAQTGARITIARHNRSSQEEKAGVALSEIRPLIEEFCAPDIEVYRHARALAGH